MIPRPVAVAAACGLCVAAVILYGGSCGIDHVWITADLAEYAESLDAEACHDVLDRIHEYNASCGSEIEIIDCG